MQQYGKWKLIKELGRGGQGTVYLARDSKKFDLDDIKTQISKAVLQLSPTSSKEVQVEKAEKLAQMILAYGRGEDPTHCGALKVIHAPAEMDGYSKQLERMKRELRALRKLSHPNIMPIIDENLEERWFVTKFYPEGPLSRHLARYRGDLEVALVAFRPLVEGVAQMHDKNLVHRDIKPENVFLSDDGSLVLGDLGLVHFADDTRSRITDTFENVGSRDWMPGWAMGVRVEDIRPSFDVFSLGKLLWSMVSGKPSLQLWYHHKKQFELEKMFPDKSEIRWAREVLDRCIVEEEDQCLSKANELLRIIDAVLPAVHMHSQVVAEGVERVCRVCGRGKYVNVEDEEHNTVQNFNLSPTGTTKFKVFCCKHCGHVEMFCLPRRHRPAWK